jgi:hypothetical protein
MDGGTRDDGEPDGTADIGRRLDLPDAVDMPGNDMTPKLVPNAQGPLKIELVACRPKAGGGSRDRFRGNIDGKPIIAFVDDGEADPGASDGGAEIDPRHIVATADLEAQIAMLFGRLDATDIGDDACEH